MFLKSERNPHDKCYTEVNIKYKSQTFRFSIIFCAFILFQGHSQNLKQVPQNFAKVFNVDGVTLTFYIITSW